jgi:hypothetical protein
MSKNTGPTRLPVFGRAEHKAFVHRRYVVLFRRILCPCVSALGMKTASRVGTVDASEEGWGGGAFCFKILSISAKTMLDDIVWEKFTVEYHK